MIFIVIFYFSISIQNGVAFREYVAEGINNTWTQVGKDIVLDNLNQTLVGGVIEVGKYPRICVF